MDDLGKECSIKGILKDGGQIRGKQMKNRRTGHGAKRPKFLLLLCHLISQVIF